MKVSHSRKTFIIQDLVWPELLLDNVKVNDLACLPSHKHRWHGGETDGPLCQICPPSSCPCFPSVNVLNVSWCELFFNTSPPLPALCLPPLNSASLCLYHLLNSVSLSHTHTDSPPISVPTHTPSRSLQRVLLDSGLLCTVQSSVYESLTTTQTYCTLLPLCIATRAHCIVVQEENVTKFTVTVLTAELDSKLQR